MIYDSYSLAIPLQSMQEILAVKAFINSIEYQKMTLIEVTNVLNAKGYHLFISLVSDILKEDLCVASKINS